MFHRRKLSAADTAAIVAAGEAGELQRDVAKRYGVSRQRISQIQLARSAKLEHHWLEATRNFNETIGGLT